MYRITGHYPVVSPTAATVSASRGHGVGFKSLYEALDTTIPRRPAGLPRLRRAGGVLRELIVEGIREGLDAARGRGVRLGLPLAMTAEQIRHARDLLTRPDNTVSSIARLLGVSRATIYKYVPEVTGRVAAPASSTSISVVVVRADDDRFSSSNTGSNLEQLQPYR